MEPWNISAPLTSSTATADASRLNFYVRADAYTTVKRTVDAFLLPGTTAIGMVANIINVVIFYKIGLSDSVTVTFFALALSDFGYNLFLCIVHLSITLQAVGGYIFYLNLYSLAYILYWYAYLCYDISIMITVFTAVQKCACVAIPFLFKSVFTTKRAAIIVVAIYIIALVYYSPHLTSRRLKVGFSRSYNRTQILLNLTPLKDLLLPTYKVVSRIILPLASPAILCVCMVILTIKLQQSAKLRQRMTQEKKGDKLDSSASIFNDKSEFSSRDLRAIQSVNLVSAIFVVCNVPVVVFFGCNLAISGFRDGREYHSIYQMCISFQTWMTTVNSTVNIAVYLKFNTKYHDTFKNIFGSCGSRMQEN